MRLAVRPFLMAPPDTVDFSISWHHSLPSGIEPLGDRIIDWDHRTVLSLQAQLEIDVPAVLLGIHSGRRTGLTVVVSAGSSTTRLRGPVWIGDVTATRSTRMAIDVAIAGKELGGRLDLLTQLVVTTPDPTDDLAPRQEGAILWSHRHSVVLEGDAAQFPTEHADLSQPPYDLPKAAWLLEILTDDLDAAAASAVRLVVNDTHPVMTRIREGDSSPHSLLAMSVVRWEVTRRLVDLALDLPEFADRDEDFEEDSLGWMLTGILAAHFPGETARSLRTMREMERALYEASLQNTTRAFE